MTITQTMSKADGTKKYKTELNLIDANTVVVTRIINGKIYAYTLKQNEAITMKQIAALTKIDDDLFCTISE